MTYHPQIAWSLAGQFTLNLARNNYVDQVAMIPPLFLAAAWAIASRRALAYVVFAVVVGLHAVAGCSRWASARCCC